LTAGIGAGLGAGARALAGTTAGKAVTAAASKAGTSIANSVAGQAVQGAAKAVTGAVKAAAGKTAGKVASVVRSALPGSAAKAATPSVDDLLRPGGSLIGKAGTSESIRELNGGLSEAQAMFGQLSQGGKVVTQNAKLTRVELPGGGFVQLRTVMSRSPGTEATIDVNIPGLNITKLKFNP
jgi:hypothetical protein